MAATSTIHRKKASLSALWLIIDKNDLCIPNVVAHLRETHLMSGES